MHRLAIALFAALPAFAAAADFCALVAKRGPEVLGTKLQAPPQKDTGGACAANNANGSGRLVVGTIPVPGAGAYIASLRKDLKAGESAADEPSLGKGAASIRREKGKAIEFLVPMPDRLLLVSRRERDGLTDAQIGRARAFAAEARDLR